MLTNLRRLLVSNFRGQSAALPIARSTLTSPRSRPYPASDIDLLNPDVVRNPYPHYAALKNHGSIHFLTEHNFWLVLGYDDVIHALKHPVLFSSVRATVRFDPVLNESDPPAHTRVRRVLSPYFSVHSVQALRDYGKACAEELLANSEKMAEFDLVNSFAVPLTELLIGRLLGFSKGETEDLRRLLDPHRQQLDGEVYRLLEEWLWAYLKRQQRNQSENMCRRLLRGEVETTLTPEEVVAVMKLFWVAGTTTTSRLIGASALLLLQHPCVRVELQNDLSLLPTFIEEAMRLEPSEQMVWRVARENVELSGVTIPAGSEVRLCLAAANRDVEHFPEPDCISLKRNPNNHLSLGAGTHYCIGAAMGRMLALAALETLLRTFPEYRAARPLTEISYEVSFSSRALEHLFVVTTMDNIQSSIGSASHYAL